MGWRMLYGHSAYVVQGVKVYRGSPILYGTGDLVDDYAVHPTLRNDRQLLFEFDLSAAGLARFSLHPVVIESFRVRPADELSRDWIGARVRERSGAFDTTIDGDEVLNVALG